MKRTNELPMLLGIIVVLVAVLLMLAVGPGRQPGQPGQSGKPGRPVQNPNGMPAPSGTTLGTPANAARGIPPEGPPPGVVMGFCDPDPKLFSNIKNRSGASPSAEFDDRKTLGLFSMTAFRAERERSWQKPDPQVIFPPPHPPYAPNVFEVRLEPGQRFLRDPDGRLRECKLIPYSFGYKMYDLEGRLMGMCESASFTWYEYPERF